MGKEIFPFRFYTKYVGNCGGNNIRMNRRRQNMENSQCQYKELSFILKYPVILEGDELECDGGELVSFHPPLLENKSCFILH